MSKASFAEEVFDTEASIKKLLKVEDIIPTTTDWLEVTLLCDREYSHLKQEKNLCIYEYSKILDRFHQTQEYCDQEVGFNKEDLDRCVTKYGFSDPKDWKSYKNPLLRIKDNSQDI